MSYFPVRRDQQREPTVTQQAQDLGDLRTLQEVDTVPFILTDDASRATAGPAGSIFKLWWLEGVAVVGMALSIMAIFLTVGLHERRPIPNWPIRISINSMVSVFGTIFKTCLLLVAAESLTQMKWVWYRQNSPLRFIERFDDASRGPLGGLQLIWATRAELRRAFLPVLGSLIIVLGLAIDPFIQQIVQSYQCIAETDTANATIITTRSYWPFGSGIRPTVAQAAIAGFWNISASDETAQSIFRCQGNSSCNSREVYWTLAICSECTDKSADLQATCASDGGQCNYTLPASGASRSRAFPFGTYFDMARNIDRNKDWTSTTEQETATFSNILTSFWVYKNMQPGYILPRTVPPARWSDSSPELGVAICGLRPCAQKRIPAGNFTKDRLEEEIVESVPLGIYDTAFKYTGRDEPGLNAIPMSCLTQSDEQILQRYNFTFSQFSHSYHPPGGSSYCSKQGNLKDGTPDLDLERICNNCFFSFSTDTLGDWRYIFVDQNTNFTSPRGADGKNIIQLGITIFDVSYSYTNSTKNGITGYNLSQPGGTDFAWNHFWMSGDLSFDAISSYFAYIADMFTLQIRSDVQQEPGSYNYTDTRVSNVPVTVQAYDNVICVRAAWAWTALPIALFTLALIVFFGAVAGSRGAVTQSWKSSSLPLLFHGLEGMDLQQMRELTTAEEMQEVADRVRVRLGKGSHGLALVANDVEFKKDRSGGGGFGEDDAAFQMTRTTSLDRSSLEPEVIDLDRV